VQIGRAQVTLVREDHPLAVKIGFEGFGIDYCLGELIGIDVTTFMFYHTLKARYFFLDKNGSPFIGFGIGSFSGGFGYSDINKWAVIHAGWEHAYRKFLIQFIVQYPIYEENSKSYVPFVFSINFGMRID
jgi:hypothetical protein